MSNLNTEQLRGIMQQLLREEYVTVKDGKYEFTQKMYQGMEGIQTLPVMVLPMPLKNIAYNNQLKLVELQKDWQMGFIKFIQEAQVPRQLENNKCEVYIANNYSEPAMKIFRKAIEKEGVVYEILVKSVMLYYKSNNRFKKAIGNYFVQGDWRTNYMNLMESVSTGRIEEHIKSETENGERSNYRLG